MTTAAFQHEAGTAMECLSIPITLEKEGGIDQQGQQVMRCGFKIDRLEYDCTMVTHKKAVEYIKKHPVLNLLVARKGVTHS
ncbi:tax1-binding protein 3 homolog [Hyalella azteca]|uniref:Tax1-binding protein 3 homolog n=1 Tax=Hyalella azteca TaxID=294128 RepID=A0A979FNJ4_HYAAZ|nr:tax1-binding protein 3 homolog [Hyalella azteca]